MTPSQEAREGYPLLPEPAMEDVPSELWGQNVTYPALYTAEQMRSYVDADRKARQQEAQAWVDVLAERRRQVEAEGWTAEHDDQHTDCSLARAAACYATGSTNGWPWRKEDFKDSGDGQYSENHRRMLVKAGALILAEIERLDRAAIAKGEQSHE